MDPNNRERLLRELVDLYNEEMNNCIMAVLLKDDYELSVGAHILGECIIRFADLGVPPWRIMASA